MQREYLAAELRDAQSAPPRLTLSLAAYAAGAALIVFAAYWPLLSAQALSFDDREAVAENHLIQDPGWNSVARLFLEILRPSTVRGYYRPLTQMSLMLDWARGGRPDNLRPFHETSLALHVANTALIIVIEVLRQKPDHVEARVNLGLAHLQLGNSERAEQYLQDSVRLQPRLAEAHDYLGVAFLNQRKYFAANDSLREAVRLSPESFRELNNLAWLLAACPVDSIRTGPEAITLARRACERTGFREPRSLYIMAAATAESGRFAEAIEACNRAIRIADAQGDLALAQSCREAVRFYEEKRPLRLPQ